MPKFLERELEKEYGNDKHAIYGTMNKIGAMKGNKETSKGRAMEKKHEEKSNALNRHKVKEKHEKDYNDRNRSWDSKNRYYGSGVGGNTI